MTERQPTPEERELLARRRAQFPRIVSEIDGEIAALAHSVGADDPHRDPDALESLARRLDDALAAGLPGHRNRLHAQLMYLIGELLLARHGGYWFLQSDPGSDLFGRYVVGGWEDGTDPELIVDPSAVAYKALERGGEAPVSKALTEIPFT